MLENQPDKEPTRRRGFDPFTLFVGLATLFGSAYILSDGRLGLAPLDYKWVIAAAAVLIGLLVLAASLRRR